jgi:hypothetical protein
MLVPSVILLACVVLPRGANAQHTLGSHPAVVAAQAYLAPAKFEPWNAAYGDINADGFTDAAVILTSPRENGERDERLLVLLGSSSGVYTVLSASATYCRTRHHYQLEIRGTSLFVQGVTGIYPRDISSSTLRFKFNRKMRDFELVGKENLQEDTEQEGGSIYREIADYTRGMAVHSRKKGRRYVEVKQRLPGAPLVRLNGFDCQNHDFPHANVYVDKDFSIKR